VRREGSQRERAEPEGPGDAWKVTT